MKRQIEIIKSIPTPSMMFNHESLIGGIPLAHLSFFYGPTGSWKSTFLIETAGIVQKLGGRAKWYNEERRYTDKWAYHYGVDISKIELSKNRTAVELFESLTADMDSEDNNDLQLIVVDSLMGVMYVKKKKRKKDEDEGDEKGIEASMHEKASISRFLKEAVPFVTGAMKAREKRGMSIPAVAFTNHFKVNPMAMFSKPTYMPGGSTIYHEAAMIIEMVVSGKVSKQVGGKKLVIGCTVKGRFEKNSCDIEAQNNTFEFDVFTRKNNIAPIGINKGLDRLKAGLLTGMIVQPVGGGVYEFDGIRFKTEISCLQYLTKMEFSEAYMKLLTRK